METHSCFHKNGKSLHALLPWMIPFHMNGANDCVRVFMGFIEQ